jgi:RNA polymerase sigma-70 factor (ECF subfamily)
MVGVRHDTAMTDRATVAADVADFVEHRDHLFGVAYRMLGSVAEAEDVVQEAYLRWAGADRSEVERPVAWLTTVTTRLCLDRLRSAQVRRESYVGPWLPEPLLTDDDAVPEAAAELSDSLTTAFLVLLERLNPLERAVFLLHDVFGYGFEEIAAVVERPVASCRQVASRARRAVAPERRTRYTVAPDEERRLIGTFLQASGSGDIDGLLALLAEDVELWSDGGARRHAARHPIIGPARVARFCANIGRRAVPRASVRFVRIGGDPGVVFTDDVDGSKMTVAFELSAGGIRRLHLVVNPDKLAHVPATP